VHDAGRRGDGEPRIAVDGEVERIVGLGDAALPARDVVLAARGKGNRILRVRDSTVSNFTSSAR